MNLVFFYFIDHLASEISKEREIMKYEQSVTKILEFIGGKNNIRSVSHCVTRLRFVVIDEEKVDMESIKKIPEVITVVNSMGQIQVVIGNKVNEFYESVVELVGTDLEGTAPLAGNFLNQILQVFSSIFTPIIPALAGSGMIKGILALVALIALNQFGFDIKSTDTYKILFGASDALFYFMPIILGFTSAKTFKTNPYVAMVIGGTLVYPAVIALLGSDVDVILLGMKVTKTTYVASVIPIIIAIFALSYVEKFLKKIVPDVIKLIVVPALSLLIMVPATLLLFGPIGIYLGNGISAVYRALESFSAILTGGFIGALWCTFVIFGAHRAIVPIGLNSIATIGKQTLFAFTTAANISQAGAAMGVFFKTKKEDLKTVSMSASITALFGITEPAIYGVNLRFKKPMLIAGIGGGLGGAFIGWAGSYATTFANQGILTFASYAEAGARLFTLFVIGNLISFTVSGALTYFFGYNDEMV